MTAFSYSMIAAEAAKPVIGMIILQADETLETDLRRSFSPEKCDILVARIASETEVSTDSLSAMEGRLTQTAALFPAGLELDAVGYGCTSATSVIGPEKVHGLIRAGCGCETITEPVTALLNACRKRGISRIAFLSPYVESVSAKLREVLAEGGLASPVFGSFDEAEEAKVTRIDEQSLFDAAVELAASDAVDGIFLSCTNLKTLDVLPRIEAATGKLALSSNSVLIAHLRELALRH